VAAIEHWQVVRVVGESTEPTGDARAPVLTLAVEPLAQGSKDGIGQRLTRGGRKFPSKVVSFWILDAEGHARSIDTTPPIENRCSRGLPDNTTTARASLA